jgi:exodeoxyribonuclease VII large subunit
MKNVDCVILARGGGARDDLSPFDDERVVRAVRSCPVPVVTGIGHQIDSSLADLASDAALPTPSAAAERVFPDREEIRVLLSHKLNAVLAGVLRTGERFEARTEHLCERLTSRIEAMLREMETTVGYAEKQIVSGIGRVTERNDAVIASFAAALDALSPLSTLGRGYSICRSPGGAVIRSAEEIRAGDKVNLLFKDGFAEADITGVTVTAE